MNKNGSALIFALLLMTFLGIIITIYTRSTLLYYSFSLDRMQLIKAQYALDALGQYAVARAFNRNQQLTNEEIAPWPPDNGPYKGVISINSLEKTAVVYGELFLDTTILGKVQCTVELPEKGPKKIIQWAYV